MEDEARRRFLGVCLGGLGAAAAGGVLWPVYRYLTPRSGDEAGRTFSMAEQDLPEGAVKFFDFAGSAAVLVRKKGGELVALSAVCSHLGCIVQWDKARMSFVCPCHGGQFSTDGVVLAGPPPRALAKLPVSVAKGVITVG
ncbi:ubiquinol-cytochrome c reductase iron-sulfur subunit [Pelotalea chapellei]|uniref:Rieske (2Fe-2S) protein n=1 Tax=Pelotalea chapellei TaxID=44671 RepID=A0ABS5U659_9BACT|nr:Rieske (2Fe-2S) protein [Pelotalea chapellei]MBT1071146.1 Rieske (2Fe-2S) protein [Pelotalea chapellei]